VRRVLAKPREATRAGVITARAGALRAELQTKGEDAVFVTGAGGSAWSFLETAAEALIPLPLAVDLDHWQREGCFARPK
jgi:hypothetical protein